MESQEQLGTYLRQLRSARNLSLRKAAAGVGVSASRLGELEANRSRVTHKATKPATDLLIKLARFYDQPLGTLLALAGVAPHSSQAPLEAEMLMYFRRLAAREQSLLVAIARTMDAQNRQDDESADTPHA